MRNFERTRNTFLSALLVTGFFVGPDTALATEPKKKEPTRAVSNASRAPASEGRVRRFLLKITEKEKQLVERAREFFARAEKLPPPPAKLQERMQMEADAGLVTDESTAALSPAKRKIAEETLCSIPTKISVPSGATEVKSPVTDPSMCELIKERENQFVNRYKAEFSYDSILTFAMRRGPTQFNDKRYGMTDSQLVSIIGYTGSDYNKVNISLRTGSTQYEWYRQTLNVALDKIPDFTEPVNRGAFLPAPVLAQHVVGAIVEYKAFTSTSTAYGFGSMHRFVIYPKHGKPVWHYSQIPGEKEVLFKAPSRFLVIGRRDTAYSGNVEFTLQEMDDQDIELHERVPYDPTQ